MFVYLMVIVFHALTMDIWPTIVNLLTSTTIKDHCILINHSGMQIYLMAIDFYVLTMDIWLGIVKFLTSTIIICNTLEASLQDQETGSTMIFSEENMC